MTWYKNVGLSLWRRSNGKVVAPGQTFEATPREERRIARRTHLHKRLQLIDAPVEAKAPTMVTIPGEEVWPREWKLQMGPRLYLKIHPTGPNVELAQRLVAEADSAREAAEDDTEEEDQ